MSVGCHRNEIPSSAHHGRGDGVVPNEQLTLSLAMMTSSVNQPVANAVREPRSLARALLSAMRPMQAPKNGLVLVPLIFSVNIWFAVDDVSGMFEIVLRALGATIAFTLLSGAIYLINDLADIERDRAHPVKRHRAIASGDLPIRIAYAAAVVALLLAAAISLVISVPQAVVAAGYLILNLAYTFKLKHVAILDVMSVAAGFVLRAYAGYVAIGGPVPWLSDGGLTVDIDVSPWFYIMTALGSLLIALGKRRAELKTAGDAAANQRSILGQYTTEFIDALIMSTATLTIFTYALYAIDLGDTGANVPADNTMMVTIPFVAYGIYRYLYLLYVKGEGEAPETVLLRDRPTLLNGFLWLAVASTILLIHTIGTANGS